MKLAIIKYGSGNVQSVSFALERLGVHGFVTENAEEIMSADKVIFPGVGEASYAMKQLREKGLDKVITDLKQPLLGICLGMQLLCGHSEEGDTEGLGIFDTKVKRFPLRENFKIPHMGWNTISSMKGPLYKGLPEHDHVYYVHSYYAELCEETTAVTDYIIEYSASLQKNNFHAVQFHPEKSGVAGEFIIRNFIQL